MTVLRTPDARFNGLPGYDFDPNYIILDGGDLGDLRLHYVDEGSGPTVLMMHGEPSWSYLYRDMIRVVSAAGFRVIAPDLIGFGRSDKPAAQSNYTYAAHVGWMHQFLGKADIRDAVLFCQDWGGLIGLRLVAEDPDRFRGVIAGNTGLPVGKGFASEAFLKWREFSRSAPEFDIGMILQGASERELTPAEIDAYRAPFPDESYKAAARIFPSLVPIDKHDPAIPANRAAWESLSKFDKPFLTCFSDKDPVTAGGEKPFVARVPGAKGQPHTILKGGGHFLQEDLPDQLSDIIVDFMARL